jgi:hypothetical protein
MLSLVDDSFSLEMELPRALLTLAMCYKAYRELDRAKELVRKAFKMSMCTDTDHFKFNLPIAAKFPFLRECCN